MATYLGQPAHDDRKEESKKARNSRWQYTRYDSERSGRSHRPVIKEWDVYRQLRPFKQSSARMESDKPRTAVKLANTEMTKRGTVLKKQTSARNQKPIAFLRAISMSDLFMFSQICTKS